MSTTTTTGAAVAAPAGGLRGSEAPRVPFSHLTGDAAREVREVGARLLADRDAHRGGMEFGGGCGPDRITRDEYRSGRVSFEVHDAAAIASQRAWHGFWRDDSDPVGGYDMKDPEKRAAAPPEPSYGVEFVAEGTWEQLRAWLEAPQQTSMFDLLGGAA